jgi:hypothetical protein
MDEDSLEAKGKVENGSLRGASMGICFDEVSMNGELFVITKSTLYEASLVSIPENPEALIIPEVNIETVEMPMEMGFVMLSKDGVEVNDFKNYVTNMLKTEEVKVEETVIVEEPIVVVEPLKPLDENVIKLHKEMDSLNDILKMKDAELVQLKSKVLEYEAIRFKKFMSEAVQLGKITEESIVDYEDLPFEKTERMINKLPAKGHVSLGKLLSDNKVKESEKDFGWYLKNDKKYLSKLAKEDFTRYKAMETQYYNNK